MKQLFFALLPGFFTLAGFAQGSVKAMSTATIVSPVGVTELSAPLSSLPSSPSSFLSKGGTKSLTTKQKPLAVANFQLWGMTDEQCLFTLSAPSVWLVNQKDGTHFLLDALQVEAAVSQPPGQFTLYGTPLMPKQPSKGTYTCQTPVLLTVYVN